MIDNDSTDTNDSWTDNNPNDYDYWTSFDKTVTDSYGNTKSIDGRSKLKYFKYTFSNEDILKVVNDRLFTKRNYTTLQNDESLTVSTIDKELFNELLDNGEVDTLTVNSTYWNWNSDNEVYEINYEAVKDLDPQEFLIFIQTHLTTFHKVKKKWYQSGLFGFIMIVVVVIIAVWTQQYQLLGTLTIGETLMYAGLILSISGALLGNEVMMIGGQIISIVGATMTLATTIAKEEALLASSIKELTQAGLSGTTLQTAIAAIESEFLLNNMLMLGKFALNTFDTLSGIMGESENITPIQTPEESMSTIFIAENQSWEGINKMFPEYVLASTIKSM
jgi:hypothetical protein